MPGLRVPKGRGTAYSTAHTCKLLELAENHLPLGMDEWEIVASHFNAYFGHNSSRTGEELRNKFKTLKNSKKPTGNPNCPPEIVGAKRIYRLMEDRMAVTELSEDVIIFVI